MQIRWSSNAPFTRKKDQLGARYEYWRDGGLFENIRFILTVLSPEKKAAFNACVKEGAFPPELEQTESAAVFFLMHLPSKAKIDPHEFYEGAKEAINRSLQAFETKTFEQFALIGEDMSGKELDEEQLLVLQSGFSADGYRDFANLRKKYTGSVKLQVHGVHLWQTIPYQENKTDRLEVDVLVKSTLQQVDSEETEEEEGSAKAVPTNLRWIFRFDTDASAARNVEWFISAVHELGAETN